MLLRVANEPDVESIESLLLADHVTDFVSSATPEEILASIRDPDEEYLLAIEDGVTVGLGLLAGLGSRHRTVELRKIAVATSGLGHGTTLLALLQERSFDVHDAHRLWLDVYPHNTTARHLYRKAGFVEEGTLRDAYWVNGEVRSVIILSVLEPDYRTGR